MQKHFENLIGFKAGDNMPEVDWIERLLNGIFATAGSAILAYIVLLMMQFYMRWNIVNL
ncbi:hypothetical protein ACOAOT_23695 [Lacrimispora sp. AGF001]|uniref:hypothetical protein n=1 Tax=Lacrimispora sp. AGF001 TaxID=3401631 RepID=UPI003B42AF93